jgi:hypothetical protein
VKEWLVDFAKPALQASSSGETNVAPEPDRSTACAGVVEKTKAAALRATANLERVLTLMIPFQGLIMSLMDAPTLGREINCENPNCEPKLKSR